LKDKRREGAKVIKRYHVPATPYERALERFPLDMGHNVYPACRK